MNTSDISFCAYCLMPVTYRAVFLHCYLFIIFERITNNNNSNNSLTVDFIVAPIIAIITTINIKCAVR